MQSPSLTTRRVWRFLREKCVCVTLAVALWIGVPAAYYAGVREGARRQVTPSTANAAPTTPSGSTVYRTATGTKYHREGCQHLRGSRAAVSVEEAHAAGLTACGTCKP